MTHQEIKELAGHRAVSPWVMKLVNDAGMKEREACAKVARQISDKYAYGYYGNEVDTADEIETAIRARKEKK